MNPAPAGVFELRVMRADMPDVLVWRKTMDDIKIARRSFLNYDRLVGFVVSQDGSRMDLYDNKGSFIGAPERSARCVSYGASASPDAAGGIAKRVLKNPYLLSEVHRRSGSAVNLAANHDSIAAMLLDVKGMEKHMLGVSMAADDGGDFLYMDPAASPAAGQDLFLDHMKNLKEGFVIDWAYFDREMLRAARSYRSSDFCDWVAECMPDMEGVEVSLRLSALSEKDVHRVCLETVAVLLPHVIYHVGENKGYPEFIDPDAKITLPRSMLAALS